MNEIFNKSNTLAKAQADEKLKLDTKFAEEHAKFLAQIDLPVGTRVQFWTVFGDWSLATVTKAPFFDPDLRAVAIELDNHEFGSDQFLIFPEPCKFQAYFSFSEWKLVLDIKTGSFGDIDRKISTVKTLGELYLEYIKRVDQTPHDKGLL